MPRTEQQMIDYIQLKLADTAAATWTEAELRDYKTWALVELAKYVPYWRTEQFNLETRTGTASSTKTDALVDATESQFVSTDAGKVVFNNHDKTWAIVTAYVSASELTLSKDIMASGEGYELFNRYCYNNKQVDISEVDDWLRIESAEYPYGHPRNVEVLEQNKVLEIQYDGILNDTSVANSTAYKDVFVKLATIHRLPNMTDTVGAVANTAGYAVASTSIAVDALSGAEVIPQHSLFSIAGVRGTYRTTASVTLSGSATSALPFYPGLKDAVADNDVVTFVASTLTPELEEAFADLVAAKAILDKSNKYLNSATFNQGAWANYQNVGQMRMAEVKKTLNRMAGHRTATKYPRQ